MGRGERGIRQQMVGERITLPRVWSGVAPSSETREIGEEPPVCTPS